MKIPKFIACLASYYNSDPSVIVMHSIVILKTSNDTLEVTRYFDLSDYTEDEAYTEMESIIESYKSKGKNIDVLTVRTPNKLEVLGSGYNLKVVTAKDYPIVMKNRTRF